MRAIFHHQCSPWLRDRIDAVMGEVQVTDIAEATGRGLDRALSDADVLLHVLHPVTDAMMAAAPQLTLIQKIGVGVDAIDLEAAQQRGIAVCNMPGTNTQAVVELTLGLMLGVLRRIPLLDHRLRINGDWALPLVAQGQFGEIAGKVVGLVGYGHVAKRLAVVVQALGAEVLVTTRGSVDTENMRQVTKDELLAQADIVSLHIPETRETRNWLDADAIAKMKPGAIVINSARGGLIDEAALIAALVSGHVAGAGLDSFAQEPLKPDAAILTAPNVVTLPHVAWLTRETLERSLQAAVENISRLEDGKPLNNRQA